MKKILVIGSLNMDVVVSMESMPTVGETVLGSSYWNSPGGKGANQAYTIARLGGEVAILGCLGKDDFGKELLQNLSVAGVNTENIKISDEFATGTAFIFTDSNADNSIVTIAGANKACDIPYIERYGQLIKECDYLLVQMEIPLRTIYYAIEKANSLGKTVILNPAPAPNGLPDQIMQKIDVITPNETELATISGVDTGSMEGIIKGSRKLIASGIKTVIVTLGKRGALWVNEEHCREIEGIAVKAVDTTAAGDCFNGALTLELAKGAGLETAIQKANITAALSVTKKGAQTSIPTKSDVEDLLEENYL